ncbi:MAG TPA: hypothetical protein VMZ26_10590, partial [Pyrinomonadaceae bacterium]|nr:hypothetical protein [Pyrinomonadaceae bacterium]
MKRCPECRRSYTDETLLYCLDDGTALLDGPAVESEEPTRRFTQATQPGETAILSVPSDDIRVPSASNRNFLSAGVLGILIVAVLGLGGYWLFRGGTAKQIGSIAVMPFVNESGNGDVEYLSDGMTETLIESLSRLPNLSVKARSSVFRYKGREVDAKAVGKE